MIAQIVKQTLDTRKVVEYYGFKVDTRGFTPCPFHRDKTASMKVYTGSRGYNCYGCHANGSIIDFVMKMFNINYFSAITRLNYDFSLNLGFEKPNNRELNEIRKRNAIKKRQQKRDKEKKQSDDLKHREAYFDYHRLKEDINDDFWDALAKLMRMEDEYFGT